MQISQGKARDFHLMPAAYTSGGLDDIGLWVPPPPCPHLDASVYGSCTSGQGFAYSFLPTQPRGYAVAVRLGVPVIRASRGTFTSKSLPGRFSPSSSPVPAGWCPVHFPPPCFAPATGCVLQGPGGLFIRSPIRVSRGKTGLRQSWHCAPCLAHGGRPDDHSTWPPVPTPRADFPHGADDTCIREFSTDCKQCGAWAYQQP